MTRRADDALEILLPDSHEAELTRARKVTHFLRLLSDDAQPRRASSVGIDFERARGELERQDRACLEQALVDLLRHHLTAATSAGSFAWFGDADLDVQSAWQVVSELRAGTPWLAGVPEPGEAAHSVGDRLLASLEQLRIAPEELALWNARRTRAVCGPRAAEAPFRRALANAARAAVPARVQRQLVAGLAECLLDRGALREARSWLFEHLALIGDDARLRQLLAWTRLCLGDHAGAKSVLAGLRPWSGPLPFALFELRERCGDWLSCLAGRCDAHAAAVPASTADAVRDRSDVGAAVFGVFTLRRDHSAVALHLDVAPALRASVERWLGEREGACALPDALEHRLVVGARAVFAHREGTSPLTGVLGAEASVACALAPVLDDDGEAAGWLYVECEHHLLPSRRRLAELASGWRSAVLAAAHGAPTSTNGPSAARAAHERHGAREHLRAETDSPARQVFESLIAELGIKTLQRRWWGFALDRDELALVASGGEGAGLSQRATGQRAALRRAWITGGMVLFEEPDERLAIQAEAGSGLAVPLFAGGRICGLLAIESSRRRDFRASDLARFAAPIERFGLALRVAQFRAWHRARFGFDVWLDAQRPDFRVFAAHLLAGARSRTPVVLAGPAGAGKLVLTRWLHFESAAASGPLRVVTCGVDGDRADWNRLVASAAGGSLVLDDLEALRVSHQEEWLRWLERVDSVEFPAGVHGAHAPDADALDPDVARVFANTRVPLAASSLRPDLALRLDRLELRVPPLAARREDIVPLVRCLCERFAAEEGLRPPEFSDEALALLWRQRWDGNVCELENLVYKLVLVHRARAGASGELLSYEQVLETARHFSIDLVRRMPSRHPARADLVAALRTTRKPGGRLNKTRAALYLGWDPDTLVARMLEAGIDEESPSHEAAWKIEATAACESPSGPEPSASERDGPRP